MISLAHRLTFHPRFDFWGKLSANPQTRTAALSQIRVNGAWDSQCGPAGGLRCGPAGVLRCGPAGFCVIALLRYCVIALLRGPAGRLGFAVARLGFIQSDTTSQRFCDRNAVKMGAVRTRFFELKTLLNLRVTQPKF